MEEGAKALSDIPAINRFLSYCRIRTVPSKTVIIHAGDLPDILYYIISGSVEVMIEDEDGNEMVLAYLLSLIHIFTACEAITVAAVARITSGHSDQSGAIRKNGLEMAAGLWISRAPWPK